MPWPRQGPPRESWHRPTDKNTDHCNGGNDEDGDEETFGSLQPRGWLGSRKRRTGGNGALLVSFRQSGQPDVEAGREIPNAESRHQDRSREHPMEQLLRQPLHIHRRRQAPDAAMVKLFAQPRLVEMGALEPIGDRLEKWAGKADLLDNLLTLNKGPDGQQYYLPIQYVVLYLYYRPDLFKAAGLEPPKTCEEFLNAAKTLTKAPDQYGFGFRGGKGGWDQWGTFVFSKGAKFEKGGLTTPDA